MKAQGGEFQTYGLLAVSTGVNTSILKLFREMDFGYEAPQTAKLLVREYYLGDEDVSAYLGSAFHAFLLDIPGLDYGAIIPKGDYMTVCLLSSHSDLHSGTLDTFLEHPAVKSTLPPDFSAEAFACWCGPRINVVGSKRPFDDRIVFIGDSGVSRLYKDGIGAAYRTAKAAARTAVFQGVSAEDFKRHYLPLCREIENDNRIGKSLFMIVGRINKIPSVRHAVLRMVAREQKGPASLERHMSMIVWDMLTGGAPYREVLVRLFRPVFQIRFLWNLVLSVFSRNEASQTAELTLSPRQVTEEDDPQMVEADVMKSNVLGKVYQDGEVIFHKGDVGDFMLVIQDGQVEVVGEVGDQEVRLAVSGPGEVIGEMAIFEHRARSATVRALGSARVLTVDEKTFLRYVHQDPSLAFQLLKMMSKRVRKLGRELTHLTVNQRSAEEDTKKWPPARSV